MKTINAILIFSTLLPLSACVDSSENPAENSSTQSASSTSVQNSATTSDSAASQFDEKRPHRIVDKKRVNQ